MAHWGMVINVSRCIGCYACFIACKDEYWQNDYPPYSAAQERHGKYWIDLVKRERGVFPYVKVAFMPLLCLQCNEAPCIKSAKDGAVYRRDDGIVIIDPEKAVGQKKIVESCPWGVIGWNQEKNLAQKCTFCVHRLEDGKAPRCVQICPYHCLSFGDFDDPNSDVSKLLKSAKCEVYHPEYDASAKPRVYYMDLHKITKNFIAGAVVLGDVNECAEGATLALNSNGKATKIKANIYGNFEFDGLEPGKYSVNVEYKGYKPQTAVVELKDKSQYMGDIILVKP